MSARTHYLAAKKQAEKQRRERIWYILDEYVFPVVSGVICWFGMLFCIAIFG